MTAAERAEKQRLDKQESWLMELAQVKELTNGRPLPFLELLEQRAKEINPDYPYEGSNAFDWLWAISCAYTGTHQANQDCHAFIKHLAGKLGIADEDLYQEWQTFKASKGMQ